MAGKKPAPTTPAEHNARAPEPWQDAAGTIPAVAPGDPVGRVDLCAMERALQQIYSGYMDDVLEGMATTRRKVYADHARTRIPRRCPCGAPHSLAEVCR